MQKIKKRKENKKMTKEKLKELGLTEELAIKVFKEWEGKYVDKIKFDEINKELTTAKNSIGERDKQLETLKKGSTDVESLAKKIEELQIENKAKEDTHNLEIKNLKFETALNSILTLSKAKNPETVKPLLKQFLEKAEMDGDNIKGLEDEVKKLTESDDTKFLFNTDNKNASQTLKGMIPGESRDKNGDVLSGDLSFSEAIKANVEAQFN